MNARALNILCLLLMVALAVWSAVLWRDGAASAAIYALVWAIVAPALVRSVSTL